MTQKNIDYIEYIQREVQVFKNYDLARRFMFVNELKDLSVESVLDVGCGSGQEMFPFLEKTEAFCIGVDAAPELTEVRKKVFDGQDVASRVAFVRSLGEKLPFADESFDVVICRVALPYMDNRKALSEISRVLKSGGIFFLKIHAPAFYLGMLKRRLTKFSVKQMAYPIICLAGGMWHSLTGTQPNGKFWNGKEIFQTKSFLRKELERNNLHIEKTMPDSNKATPSFLIVKK